MDMSRRTVDSLREFDLDLARSFGGDVSSGGCGRSPSPLKIEAAEPACYVNDFSDEIEAQAFLALHCFAGEFFGVDAAGGDLGFFVAFGCRGIDFPIVNSSFQRF